MSSGVDLVTDIQQAVLKWFASPALVGNFVLLAEVTDEEGDTNLLSAHNLDMEEWQEIGLLEYRLQDIKRHGHTFVLIDEDDDD